MKHYIFLLSILLFWSCSNHQEQSLNIATAANAQFAMKEIGKAFTHETGIQCNIIIGSSGKLTAQIKEGAPYDVFISANLKYPNEVHRSGLTVAQPKVYALGELVLWTLKAEETPTIKDLIKNTTQHIALANPKLAPYGQAAQEALKHFNIHSETSPKLVFGESISQVNQFIYSETADYGFTAKSVVLSPNMKNKGHWSVLPKESYSPIEQGVVLIKRNEKPKMGSEKFYKFLFSNKAQKILKSYGYTIPE